MKILLLLILLTAGERARGAVVGRAGDSVTLPCRYDVTSHGPLPVCWGRGRLPFSGCGRALLSTDGRGGSARGRYELRGRVEDGDVSLTIVNVTHEDAGSYGCRVHVAGLFNDVKHHLDLRVEEAPQTTTSASNTSTHTSTAGNTAGHVTSTESTPTSSTNSTVTEQQERSSVAVILFFVLFVSIILITAGGAVIFMTKWMRPKKTASSSSLQLRGRVSAVENVYQIDDGGEYETLS